MTAPHSDPGSARGSTELPLAPSVVGREAEIARLQALVGRIRDKGSAAIVFVGEAGVGKTRLVHEAERLAKAHGATVLEVACQDRDRAVAYAPWVELIRKYVDRTPRGEVYRAASPHLSALVRLAPELSDQVWLYEPTAAPVEWERRPFLAAVARFFIAITATQPLLISIDDLGWADAASLELLETLVRVGRGSALGIVGAYRDTHLEDNPALQQLMVSLDRDKVCETVTVAPLDPDRLGELISAVLTRSSVSREFRDAVYAKTRGNPFYTREVLQSLADAGAIYRTSEGWAWGSVSTITVPLSVGRTIEARVARLDEASLSVVRVASLLGLEFPLDLLRKVSEANDDVLLKSLDKAVQAKLLMETTSPDRSPGYQFSHPLIQEVLEGQASRARAQKVHLRAANVLEETYGALAKEHAASLAYHYYRGNDAIRALEYSAEAGDRAAIVFARGEAVNHYRTALELLRGGQDPPLQCRLKEALADQLRGLSEITSAATLYEEAGHDWEAIGHRRAAGDCLRKAAECFQGSLVHSLGHEKELRQHALRLLESEPHGASLVQLYLSNALNTSDEGRVQEARGEYERALALAQSLGDIESEASAYLRLAYCASTEHPEEFMEFTKQGASVVEAHHLTGPSSGLLQVNRTVHAYHFVGEVRELVTMVEAALRAARAVNDLELESWFMGLALPWVLLHAGDLRIAWANMEERRHRYQSVGLVGWASDSQSVGVRAWVGTLLGPLDRAESLLAESLEAGRHHPQWYTDAMTHQFLGRLRLAQDRPLEAIPHIEEGVSCHRKAGFPAWQLQWTCGMLDSLVRAHLQAGQPEPARQRARQAQEFAEKIGSDPARGYALRARALCAVDAARPGEALALLEKSRNIWGRLGWQYDLGVTWSDTANAYAAKGANKDAAVAFRQAIAGFSEVGAQPAIENAERRLDGLAP